MKRVEEGREGRRGERREAREGIQIDTNISLLLYC